MQVREGMSRTVLTVVLPAALPGIVSGSLLAVARAAGETAPLMFAVGAATQYNPHRDEVRAAIERECDVAVAATRRLIARDRAAGRQGLRTEDRGPRAED